MRENLDSDKVDSGQSVTMREIIAVGFRQRRLIVNTFLGILSFAILLGFLLPKKYAANMKFLVRHERAEPMVSPEPVSQNQYQTQVSEAELQSEAELIKSRDLLAQVVVACNLQDLGGSPFWSRGAESSDRKIAAATLKLEKDLTIEPIKLTNLISVTYKSKDPQIAAKVLNSLASLYLEKHLAMHRAPGQFEFFHQQAEEYGRALEAAEAKLSNFGQDQGVVSPALEKDISVRKLAEAEADAKEARATVAVDRQRIRELESQLETLPKRETTSIRTADNPQLMQSLKAKLLDLELKRTELLSKFEPTYRPVQEIEEQIKETHAAISAAENAPLRDETTDRDPTYEAVRSELAKAKTELTVTEARAAADSSVIESYRKQSETLDRKGLLQEDLLRTVKSDEENYMLYQRKEEEARISDALDQQRFSNVVVAEPASVPFTPQSRWMLVILFGILVGCLASVIAAFLADHWDPSFRTPEEVESFLGSPVVAAFPKSGD